MRQEGNKRVLMPVRAFGEIFSLRVQPLPEARSWVFIILLTHYPEAPFP